MAMPEGRPKEEMMREKMLREKMLREKMLSGGYGVAALLLLCLLPLTSLAQGSGELRGKVALSGSGEPVHNVKVTIIQLQRSVETAEDGTYRFEGVPAGRYDVSAHLERTPDILARVVVTGGQTAVADFEIRLDTLREQVTVTASGREETAVSSIQSVTIIGSLDLARKNPLSLGEALDHELGVAKRSFGPGNSRPVIRGFDGDRVLVLQEGIGIGGLGFQSGDHAEPLDLLSQDRVEVVKGPATLLYGSSAIGGVVNAISGHEDSHPGIRGYLTGIGGTTNNQSGASAGIELGSPNWLFWANGGGQRAVDYRTPLGTIENSFARTGNISGGLGYFRDRGFISLNLTADRRNYGIPSEPEHPGESEEEEEGHHHEKVRLNPRRNSVQLRGGFRDLASPVSGGNFTFQYNDYQHQEIHITDGTIGTTFRNLTTLYRGVFDQQRRGRSSGSFGVAGFHRDFRSTGEEALAPPTRQNNFAAFTLQSLDFDRVGLQFGGRVERNAYSPDGLRSRSFTGFSGSTGLRVKLSDNNIFVANYSHSYRAPALEELYNNGPHPGNLAYEIGNENLARERGNGIDLSLRRNSSRIRAEANLFAYRLDNFIYLAPTGEVADGLVKAKFAQGDSRYVGAEGRFDAGITRNFWLLSSIDYVSAQLTANGQPLPRIPPVRARLGVETFIGGFRISPELVLARRQDRVFTDETPTDGYSVFNINASWTITRKHLAHIFSVNAFNLGDKLYRNHLSLIKQYAPEIGRGVRVVYTVRFY